METSSAPTTLVERDKLDLSSLIPPKGEMESSFSWTCPFKSPISSTLCFGEPTLGKLNQETDSYMTKHMPKPSSGANRVSVRHSSLVTKNGEHFYGENFIHDFPKSWKHIKEVDWGDKLKLNYTTHGYMLMEIDWGGKFNYTSYGHPMANWQGHETHPTGHQKLIGVVMTLMNLITLHPCPSSILMTYWGEPSSYLWMRMGRERGPPFLSMSKISVNNKSQEKISSDSSSRLMETNLMTSFSYNQLMEYLEDKTDTGPLEDGFHRLKCIKDHKGPYTSSEVDWGGHDPYPNHVNESLLSEVDWGAHNPDADDPELLTGESTQSFLTFVVQLQWLVALGRLVTHAQVTTLSKLVVASS